MTRELIVQVTRKLSGAHVEASDIRGAAALVLAALLAEGTSAITGLEHLWQAYSGFEENFTGMLYEASGE